MAVENNAIPELHDKSYQIDYESVQDSLTVISTATGALNMKFSFTQLGSDEIEVDADSIIEFPAGIPGFETCHRFKLFHREGATPTVFWLQSLDDPELMFSLADPELFNISYELTLSTEEQQALCATPSDDLRLAILLSRTHHDERHNRDEIRPHMQAPIAINLTKRLALQKPLHNAKLSIQAS